MKIKPINSVTYKGEKYTSSTNLDGIILQDKILFDIIFMMAQGYYPTYLFSEIEKRYGYQYELEIEASNHNSYKADRKNHPEWWEYKIWKNISVVKGEPRFEKRLKYQRLEKLENLNKR